MRFRHLTIGTLSAAIGLLAHAPAHGVDRLYKRGLDAAAGDIVWGNEADPWPLRERLTIDPPLPLRDATPGRVEVLELYRCDIGRSYGGPRKPWRENADALMDRWRESLPSNVNVIRIPMARWPIPNGGWKWDWEFGARTELRMVLIGRALGIEADVHTTIMDALDGGPNAFRFPLQRGVRASEQDIANLRVRARDHFEIKLGVGPERFDALWDSQDIEDQMNREMRAYSHVWAMANQHDRRGRAYGNDSPPMLIINGKYVVSGHNVKRAKAAFQVANQTIARELERAKQPSRQTAEEARWRALYEELRRVRPQDTAYTEQRVPEPGQVIEIDPPLPTDTGDDALEIEFFYAYLHRGHDPARTTSWLTGHIGSLIRQAIDHVPSEVLARTRVRFTPVTEIPGHPGTTREHARMLTELALGHGYSTTAAPGEKRPTHVSFPLHNAVRKGFEFYVPPERWDEPRELKILLKRGAVYTKEYRRVAKSEEPARRADAANERFATLVTRANQASLGAFEPPAYPIILVDGRYLVTGATAGGYTNAARITNHLIAEQLAARGW